MLSFPLPRNLPQSLRLTPLDPGTPATPTRGTEQCRAALLRAHAAPRCHYVKTTGQPCGSAALRGQQYCYYHERYRPRRGSHLLPPLEDPHSVQCAIQDTVTRLLLGWIDHKTASLVLYALATASANLKRMQPGTHATADAIDINAIDVAPGVPARRPDVDELDIPRPILRTREEAEHARVFLQRVEDETFTHNPSAPRSPNQANAPA